MPLPRDSSSTSNDAIANFREEMAKMLRENFDVELPRNRMYQKPYHEFFDGERGERTASYISQNDCGNTKDKTKNKLENTSSAGPTTNSGADK